MNPNRGAAVTFALLGAVLAVLLLRAEGPATVPASAPAAQFSAERALLVLRNVLADGVPHPVGSAAHDVVRDRIVQHLRSLGYRTDVQQTFACNAHATCAPITNILARLQGDARADTLMLTAHYDSVVAGPGASDDGIGFAALLEVARAIRGQRFRNSVIIAITDGEEIGLVGAEGIMADPAVSRGIAAVINVDDRGTAGLSYLFETSEKNDWLIRRIAFALPHPVTSSLFFNIYQLLPNDTDLTVFKRAGIAGINFAAIRNVAQYHSPLDDLRHVTPSTLQDHGNHILAMTRTLANSELHPTQNENAVFFDVMQLFLLWWPQSWTRWMAAGSLVVLMFAAAVRVRDGETTAAAVTAGVLSFFVSVFGAGIVGALATWIVSIRAPTANWVAQPGPSIAAMWLIGMLTSIVVARLFYGRAAFDGLFIGHALCWTAMGVALTTVLPGASYLAVVPAMVFALAMTLRATVELHDSLAIMLCAVVTAMLWLPIALTLYDAIGKIVLAPLAAILAMLATTFTPLLAGAPGTRGASVAALAATVVVCIGMQLLLPPYTPDAPRHINVNYVDEDGKAQWRVDALTPRLQSAAPFTAGFQPVQWSATSRRIISAPAFPLPLPPPEVRIISDHHERGGRHIVLQLRSVRGAEVVGLIFRAPALAALRINGVAPPPEPARFRSALAAGWHAVTLYGMPQAQIDMTLRRDEPVSAFVVDRSYAMPPAAVPLTRARDASIAVPVNEGDGVTVRRQVRL